MHLILTGATGLVGSAALAHMLPLLQTGQVTHLFILSRRSDIPLLSSLSSEKKDGAIKTVDDNNTNNNITVIEHHDFGEYPLELLQRLKGAEGCIWTLGAPQNAVDKE